jgi:hypothetical protein
MPELWVTQLCKYISPLMPLGYSRPDKINSNHLSHILDLYAVQRGSLATNNFVGSALGPKGDEQL